MQLRVRGPAYLALTLGALVLGVSCLAYGDFVPQWQPVPKAFPWRHGFAYVSGVVLVTGAIGLLVPRLAWRAALLLTAYQIVWILADAQRGFPRGHTTLNGWLGFGEGLAEALAAVVGCFVLVALLAPKGPPRIPMHVAGVLLGISCVAFGLAHFAYADFTASMIPSWLPARMGLVYLTACCHIAAGLALITTVFARLAATLEAIMLGAFVVFVHLPSFATAPAWAPTRQIQGTELGLALLIAGSTGIVAVSLRKGR